MFHFHGRVEKETRTGAVSIVQPRHKRARMNNYLPAGIEKEHEIVTDYYRRMSVI